MRKYLINLAVSDLISGVLLMPFSLSDFILRQWVFWHFLCPATQLLQLLSVFITSITLSTIGIERYMAALHPLSKVHRLLKHHTNLIISVIWIAGIVYSAIPITHIYTIESVVNNVTYYECSWNNDIGIFKQRLFMNANLVLTFIFPSFSMTFAYVAIMRKLRNSAIGTKMAYTVALSSGGGGAGGAAVNGAKGGSSSTSGRRLPDVVVGVTASTAAGGGGGGTMLVGGAAVPSAGGTAGSRGSGASGLNLTEIKAFCSRNGTQLTVPQVLQKSAHIKNRVKIIKMLAIIILLYDICWLPIKLYQYLLDYDIIDFCSETSFYAFIYIYLSCHWLAMASSSMNPIIYSMLSVSFRNDFRQIVLKHVSSCSKKHHQRKCCPEDCPSCKERLSFQL